MNDSTVQSWLALQCRMIPRVARAVVGFEPGVDGAYGRTVCWPESETPSPGLLAACREATDRRGAVVHEARPGLAAPPVVLACPLRGQGRVLGVIAVEVSALETRQRDAVIQLLDWGSAWFELLVLGPPAVLANRLAAVVGIAAASLEHEALGAGAGAAAARIAELLDCECVSIGLSRRGGAGAGHVPGEGRVVPDRIRVVAMSGGGLPDGRSRRVRELEEVMEEAVDEGGPVAFPPLASGDALAASAHERLAQQRDGQVVCSVPLSAHGTIVGAMTLERAAARPLRPDEVELCTAVAELIGPVLELERREERPLVARLVERARNLPRWLLGPVHPARKLALLGLLAAAVTLAFAEADYRVTADATLEGAARRALVAPVQGYLEQADARAGDTVEAGQLIATIDDRDLVLERRELLTQRSELTEQYRRAVGKLDRAEVRILKAQIGQAEARLALVDEQLARTRITAPFAGVVVSGDLTQSIGAPVERGQVLFELTPLEGYRVILEVPENEVAALSLDQRGSLRLASLPGREFPFVVDRVAGLAEAGAEGSRFRVEAVLPESTPELRPGMQGVAKVTIERRPLVWVWSHRLVEQATLWLWSRLP